MILSTDSVVRAEIGCYPAVPVRTVSGHCPDLAMVSGMSNPAPSPTRRHRMEVRVTPEQDALIREAAELEHSTVTSFVLRTVTDRAERVVAERRQFVLSNESFDRFIKELDKPAVTTPELAELYGRYLKLPTR